MKCEEPCHGPTFYPSTVSSKDRNSQKQPETIQTMHDISKTASYSHSILLKKANKDNNPDKSKKPLTKNDKKLKELNIKNKIKPKQIGHQKRRQTTKPQWTKHPKTSHQVFPLLLPSEPLLRTSRGPSHDKRLSLVRLRTCLRSAARRLFALRGSKNWLLVSFPGKKSSNFLVSSSFLVGQPSNWRLSS